MQLCPFPAHSPPPPHCYPCATFHTIIVAARTDGQRTSKGYEAGIRRLKVLPSCTPAYEAQRQCITDVLWQLCHIGPCSFYHDEFLASGEHYFGIGIGVFEPVHWNATRSTGHCGYEWKDGHEAVNSVHRAPYS